jgi:hypothetical protein
MLILLSLGLGSFVYFYEIKGAAQREEIQAHKKQIFLFTADEIQSLMIKTKDVTLNLERRNSMEKPQWLIKSPILEPANDAIVAYLIDLLVKGKEERILSIPSNQLAEFNLQQPPISINIKLKNQQNHQLILGKLDFSGNFLYALVDTIPQTNVNINVLLVPKDFSNAVNRDLSEWRESGKSSQEQTLPTLPSTFFPTPNKTN